MFQSGAITDDPIEPAFGLVIGRVNNRWMSCHKGLLPATAVL
jgi:hypothetical protein